MGQMTLNHVMSAYTIKAGLGYMCGVPKWNLMPNF